MLRMDQERGEQVADSIQSVAEPVSDVAFKALTAHAVGQNRSWAGGREVEQQQAGRKNGDMQ